MAKGAALAVGLVALAGVAAHFALREPAPGSEAGGSGVSLAALPEPEAAPEVAPEAAAETGPVAAAPQPALQPAPQPVPPSFDVLRIEPDGSTLVAGRAHPGSGLAVLVDAAEVGAAVTGASGEFVALFTLPPSDAPRLMTLRMRLADGRQIVSVDQVVLSPGDIAPPEVAVAEAAPEAAPEVAVEAGDGGAKPEGEALAVAEPVPVPASVLGSPPVTGPVTGTVADPDQEAPVPVSETVAEAVAEDVPEAAAEAELAAEAGSPDADVAASAPSAGPEPVVAVTPSPEPAPAAEATLPEPASSPEPVPAPAAPAPVPEMAAILLGPEGVRVLQPGRQLAPGQIRPVSIDAISYTATGAVQMAGRGMPGAVVRLYLDTRALVDFTVAADGGWGGVLPEVTPGIYTLRADQIGADGTVTARFETPFQRETLEALAAATGQPVAGPDVVADLAEPKSTREGAKAEEAGAATVVAGAAVTEPTLAEDAAVEDAAAEGGEAVAASDVGSRPADPALADSRPEASGPAGSPTSAEGVAEAMTEAMAGSAPVDGPPLTDGARIETAAARDAVQATSAPSTAAPEVAPQAAPAAARIGEVAEAAPAAPLPAPAAVAAAPAAMPAGAPAAPAPARSAVAAVAPVAGTAGAAPVSVTVQPGFTLWAIAREQLGDGILYVQVFEANRERIRNPDLIYPGQVFAIPKPAAP